MSTSSFLVSLKAVNDLRLVFRDTDRVIVVFYAVPLCLTLLLLYLTITQKSRYTIGRLRFGIFLELSDSLIQHNELYLTLDVSNLHRSQKRLKSGSNEAKLLD